MKKKYFYDALIISIIIIISIGYTNISFQNDTFYSIPIGRDILKYGVDMIDHYSIHSLSYTYPHWLYDVCIYLLYSIGGLRLLYITNIIIYITIGVLIYYILNNLYKNRVVSSFFTISVVLSISVFITTRAQSITYILFILELFLIIKFLNTGIKKYLLLLPIISTLIVNLHCAVWPFFFMLPLPYITEYIISKIIKTNILNKKIEIEDNKNTKYLIIVLLICLLTGFITLNGLTPYTYIIKTLKGNSTTWIMEHNPPTMNELRLLYFFIISLLIIIFTNKKIKLHNIFLIIGLFILAFSSKRHIALLIMCIIYPLSDIIVSNIKNKKYEELIINLFTNKLVFITYILIATIGSFSIYTKGVAKQEYIDSKTYPIKASDYILNNLDTEKIRLFNEYDYGSYLIYRNIPVFIDSRVDLYTKEFNNLKRDIIEDYIDRELNYKEIFDYYKITHALIYKYNKKYKNNVFYNLLNKDYNTIYEDKYYAIFEINID